MRILENKFKLFLSQEFLHRFSSQLLTLFLPLYLFSELNFPLWLALLPVLAATISYGSLSFFGYKIQKKIGTKKFFILHIVLNTISTIFLILIPFYSWAFWIYIAYKPLTGLFSIWQPYQIYLSKYTSQKFRGRQISVLSIIVLLSSALGIIFGSWLLTYFGLVALASMKFVVNSLRLIPIIKFDNFFEPQLKWSFKEILSLSVSKRFRKTTTAQIVNGIIEQGDILWPIFIFISLKSYLGVGSVISIALIFQIIFFLFVGRVTDKFGRKSVLLIGTILNSIAWFGKFIIYFIPTNILIFLGIETYTKFARETSAVPFESSVYDKIDGDLDYRPLFDIMSHIGQISTFILITLALAFFPILENYIFVFFLICSGLTFLLLRICNDEK